MGIDILKDRLEIADILSIIRSCQGENTVEDQVFLMAADKFILFNFRYHPAPLQTQRLYCTIS